MSRWVSRIDYTEDCSVRNSQQRRFAKSVALCFAVLFWAASAGAVELREYRITADPVELDSILRDSLANIYIDCQFQYNGELWTNTRLRLRGESSREYPKKSFKVNFTSEGRFFLRDKINLISCWTDPTFAREHIAYDFYRRAGLRACETWFVKLYINDQYMGVYLDVEQIDEHYLDYTDLSDDATIYKADIFGAQLNADEYLEGVWSQETNSSSGFGELYELRDWLAVQPIAGFEKALAEKFDPDTLARIIALNAIIANQSTYYHNYFLIYDDGDGKWRFLPWDMDNSFYFWDDHREPPYFRSGHPVNPKLNALVLKCWQNRAMREKVFAQMDALDQELQDNSYYENDVQDIEQTLHDAVAEDTFKQYSLADFTTSILDLPAELRQRMEALRQRTEHEPFPGLCEPAIPTHDGLFVYWTPAVSPDGSPLEYVVALSDDYYFTNELRFETTSNNYFLITNPPVGYEWWRVYVKSPTSPWIPSIVSLMNYEPDANPISGTVVGNVLTADLVMTPEGSPYLLPVGLTTSQNTSLDIMAGTSVKLGAEQSITVQGDFSVHGDGADSVCFEPLDSLIGWQNIIIRSSSDTADISHAVFRGGGTLAEDSIYQFMVQVQHRPVRMTGVKFENGHDYADGLVTWWSDVELTNSDFSLPLVSNDGQDNHPEAVFLIGGTGRVENCSAVKSVDGPSGDLLEFNNQDTTIVRNCTVRNAGDDGMDFNYLGYLVLEHCIAEDCGDKAASLGTINEIHVANNRFSRCSSGFSFKSCPDVTIYNCVLNENESAIRFSHDEPSGQVRVFNTIFFGNGIPVELDDSQHDLAISHSALHGDGWLSGEGNIIGDLKLAAPTAGNFLLLEGSPLIDAGYGTGSPLLDFVGNERIDINNVTNTGAGEPDFVDIGLFEYTENPPIDPPTPESFMFVKNYPNPFNNSTRIEYGVVEEGLVELEIFNTLGQIVFTHKGVNRMGKHLIHWDGQTNSGSKLTSGVYILRVKQVAGVRLSKMILLR